MGRSPHADLLDLLTQQAAVSEKLKALESRISVPGLTLIQSKILLIIFALLESTGKAPFAEHIVALVSPGSKPRSLFYHLTKMQNLNLVMIKNTGRTPGLIYPTEKAYDLAGITPVVNPAELTSTYEKAFDFIKAHVKIHHKFPTHKEINKHLGRSYRSAGDIFYRLAKNKLIEQHDGEWRIVSS